MKLAILGCGTLGEAILRGLLASRTLAPANIVAAGRRQVRLNEISTEHQGVRTTLDSRAAIADSDVVLLTVKPQTASTLLPPLAHAFEDRHLVISALAGVRLRQLEHWIPRGALVRAMPNTPCLIREGMTVVSAGRGADDTRLEEAKRIFSAVGRVLDLDEKHLDAVTGLSGSGPAYAFVVLEALADGGVMMGLPRGAAIELAAQTMQGSARLVLESGRHPASLRDQVTTPAGCTIAGLLTLEDGGIRSTLARAIQEATRVAQGLGKTKDE